MTATTAVVEGTPLNSGYCFWFMKRGKTATTTTAPPTASSSKEETTTTATTESSSSGTTGTTTTSATTSTTNPYETGLQRISTVNTVESFWTTYNYLVRPNNLTNGTDYHFFREGIKPTWEDPSNARGGKWIVRLRKGLSSRYWEEILLALIGCQFPGIAENEICGAVVSIRYNEDILGVWNKHSADRDVTERIRDIIKRILQLPAHAHMEYKPHQTALQDKSSFRNTQVWKPKSAMDRSDPRGETTRRSGSWGEREKGSSSRAGSWRGF